MDWKSQRINKSQILNAKELIHYVNFVGDDALPIALTIDIIMKATKNDKLLHQVIKLARQSNCYKPNKSLTFLEYIENRNTIKHFLKTDSEVTVDGNLVLKSNRIVIPTDLQSHVIPLAHSEYLGIFKTKELLRTNVYFLKLDELVEKPLAKCVACQIVRKNTNIQL